MGQQTVYLVQSYSDKHGWQTRDVYVSMDAALARREKIWTKENTMVHISKMNVKGK